MKATVKKITEINRTRMIEDGWIDEYTEGMELLGGETVEIRPMIVDGRTTTQWFEGRRANGLGNHLAWFNWHISWLKDFRDE